MMNLRHAGRSSSSSCLRQSSTNSSRQCIPAAFSSSSSRPPAAAAASRRHRRSVAAAAAGEGGGGGPEPAAAARRGRGRPSRKAKEAEEQQQLQDEGLQLPDLPTPLDYQQTLVKSFTMGGVGLHTGEYAMLRVRPAHAGEGRYFVRVPEGTNRHRFEFDEGNIEDEIPIEEAEEEVPPDEDVEDLKVEWFSTYLEAQEERGFSGSFRQYLRLQVELGELPREMADKLLGGPDDPDNGFAPDVEPDLSAEPEDIVPLDPEDPSLVMAAISSVRVLDMPCTQLGEGDKQIINTELLLAALEACGVDNARIEIEGGREIPVLDNSALGWCIEIQSAGVRPAPLRFEDEVPEDALPVVMRDAIAPTQAVAVSDEDGWICFIPGCFPVVTSGVDHVRVAPVIGSQWFTWHVQDLHFRYSLAPARCYAESMDQLFLLREAGFVKAGAENLFLIANGDKWLDRDMVRMAFDEPARYKLAQLVGNLALINVAGCQGIPIGHITAHNASTALQLKFVRALVETVKEDEILPLSEVMARQEDFFERRTGRVVASRVGASRGAGDLGDGSPAEVDVEVMADDEEVETREGGEEGGGAVIKDGWLAAGSSVLEA